MNGRIEITVDGKSDIGISVKMTRMSSMEKAILMDALAMALQLDEDDRMNIGAVIAIGGLGVLTGKPPEMVKIDLGAIEKMGKNPPPSRGE